VAAPASPALSPSQLARLVASGEERAARVGEVLRRAGDRTYPLIRSNRLAYNWQDAVPSGGRDLPLVRVPGGAGLHGPSTGRLLRALGIGRELAAREEVDPPVVGGGPAGLGAAVYGASEGLDTLPITRTNETTRDSSSPAPRPTPKTCLRRTCRHLRRRRRPLRIHEAVRRSRDEGAMAVQFIHAHLAERAPAMSKGVT
jgi:NADPH-dependent 2,4-dienoyl-CoA reductase/sulfur reductase-like enzyme